MAEDMPKTCPGCGGSGRFETECCSGAGGCSCRGEIVELGSCRVCGGTGQVVDGAYDRMANRNAIQSLHFIGSGPNHSYGIWPKRGGYGG
jgi:hypothetical protein